MNNQGINPKRIFVICTVVVLALIGLLMWHVLTFHIISTEPSEGKVSTISPFFKVNFSQELSDVGTQVSSRPAGTTGTPTVSGKVLTIPLNVPLATNTVYTITIVSVTSVSGKKITDKSYSFVPTYIPSSSLPEDQQQALLKLQYDSGGNVNDPIVKHLPYRTTDFTLTADEVPTKNPPKKFPLIATITLSQADMGDEAAAEAQYEGEVVSYITSLGLNADNYAITYVIQTP